MSEIADQSELVTKWQLKVDELATNLLLNGPDNSVLAGLKQLSEDAGGAGFSGLAQAASQIFGELSSQSLGGSGIDEEFRKGLVTIQQILSTTLPSSGSTMASDPSS